MVLNALSVQIRSYASNAVALKSGELKAVLKKIRSRVETISKQHA